MVSDNPELPIFYIVDDRMVDHSNALSMDKTFIYCEITEFYKGLKEVHFPEELPEYILEDIEDRQSVEYLQSRNTNKMSDDEMEEIIKRLPWKKCIVAYFLNIIED